MTQSVTGNGDKVMLKKKHLLFLHNDELDWTISEARILIIDYFLCQEGTHICSVALTTVTTAAAADYLQNDNYDFYVVLPCY